MKHQDEYPINQPEDDSELSAADDKILRQEFTDLNNLMNNPAYKEYLAYLDQYISNMTQNSLNPPNSIETFFFREQLIGSIRRTAELRNLHVDRWKELKEILETTQTNKK